MTQNERILNHLQTRGSITAREADELYGCTRLAARIKNLRNAGHVIMTQQVTGQNRFGDKTRYARYTMGG